MIADGVHLHPAVVDLIVRAKGPSRVALVTDAMRAAGMPEGRSELGGQVVIVKDGVARLESGSLAGSTLAMDRAVANVRRFAHVSLAEAVQMASSTPGAPHRPRPLQGQPRPRDGCRHHHPRP